MPVKGRLTGRRIALGLGTALIAAGAFADASVNISHSRSPEAALMFDSSDPVALVRKAQADLNAGNLSSDELLTIVQRAVKQSPLNAAAFRLSGLSSAANAEKPQVVRAQMAVSERIERRDAAAHLWLIEDAVERNDIAAALRHYDKALRVAGSTQVVLYPVLTDALESPIIRERFAAYMKAPPPWLESFLRFAVSNTKSPVAIADLARLSGGFPKGSAYSSLDRELLTQLVASGNYSAAIAHFRRIDGADGKVASTLELTAASADDAFAPVAWQPFSIEGIEPFLVASDSGGDAVEIEAEMEAGYRGPVARKIVALKPGRYALTSRLRAEDFGNVDKLVWTLACAGEGGAVLVSEAVDMKSEFTVSTTFTVPAGCPAQLATVSAETGVKSGYVTLVLASASARPAR